MRLAAILLGTALLLLPTGSPDVIAGQAVASQGGVLIEIPSRHVDGFQDLFAPGRQRTETTIARLVLPARRPAPRGLPAMVVLHGSGGEWSGRGARHAAFLSEHGIASMVVDTFRGRGVDRSTRYLDRLSAANIPDQIADAYAALDFLAGHPRIDPERIGVMGYSMGGASTLLAAAQSVAEAAGGSDARFAVHVSFYAPCFIETETPRTTGAPIVALWGEKDETADRPVCEGFADRLRAGGSPVETHWLAGAPHGWNGLRPPRFSRTAPTVTPCRYVVADDGTTTERITGRSASTDIDLIDVLRNCSDQGYTIGWHAAADRIANQVLLEAIAATARPD